MTNEQIARINELYHKSKAEGLTPEETKEQKMLRQAYIADIKKNVQSQIDNINFVNPDGSITPANAMKKKK